jgi:hypothetical protein
MKHANTKIQTIKNIQKKPATIKKGRDTSRVPGIKIFFGWFVLFVYRRRADSSCRADVESRVRFPRSCPFIFTVLGGGPVPVGSLATGCTGGV